jgi:glyoxylase-like metal-dependent hydrolase (beta-lactamase superfamily II)
VTLIRIALLALLLSGAMAHAEDSARSVKLYTLDCGRIDIANMDAFADDGSYAGVSRQLVVPCYLIRHARGDLIWDAGIGDQFAGPEGITLLPGYVAHVPITLESQLRRLGLSFADITYLGFSHEHIDHIGNANAFGRATWLLNQREHAWAVAHDGRNGDPPALLSASKSARVRTIEGDLDLFGDGSITIIQAPGHTPGHQILLARPTGETPVLLGGDLWHSRSNYDHDRVPQFNTSRSETLSSFNKVREIARETGAKILIAHEPDDFHPAFNPDWRHQP